MHAGTVLFKSLKKKWKRIITVFFSMLLVWVLVVFLEEDVLSHPIRLEEVQDLIGRNGVEADLQERDECMARYYVGDQLRAALIYKRSGQFETRF